MQSRRLGTFLLCLIAATTALALPVNEWAYRQTVQVPAGGLVKIDLPAATLDAARADLADLRLLDPQGREVPLLLEHPRAPQTVARKAKTTTISLEEQRTVVLVETGFDGTLDSVTLHTADESFVKSVTVEGSDDKATWTTLVTKHPLYGTTSDGGKIALPPGKWRWLRLTLDDRRAEAVAVSGVEIGGLDDDLAAPASEALVLRSRDETPGETRLTLTLPARNLPVSALVLTTDEPIFQRRVRVVQSRFEEQGIVESEVAAGTISRAAGVGGENLRLALERVLPEREVVLVIDNEDNPPLPVAEVRALVRPVRLVFHAAEAGEYRLLVGNARATAPRYDLAAFAGELSKLRPVALQIGGLVPQPEFAPSEPLPEVPTQGSPLDVAPWTYRKAVRPAAAGVQQLELDAEVLAHAAGDFSDLRLVNAGAQVPYVLQRTSLTRAVKVTVEAAPDAKRPTVSRWKLTVPQSDLPVVCLTATLGGTLFQRTVRLYSNEEDRRGNAWEQTLGHATWTQTPSRRTKTFSLGLSSRVGDTLWLETDNGDNPALALEQVELHYPVTRVLFKTTAAQPLALYYGNARISAPRYDLSLVGGTLLAAEKTVPALGAEETLKEVSGGSRALKAHAGWLFWGGLAVVVVVLLVVVAKLLPKPPTAS
ncbi:MAG TPA: DUF3999 family protein [Opitutaceae bacterium]|nr:DUF3999 family protein [Opitutaceae bacterium]